MKRFQPRAYFLFSVLSMRKGEALGRGPRFSQPAGPLPVPQPLPACVSRALWPLVPGEARDSPAHPEVLGPRAAGAPHAVIAKAHFP